MINTAAEVAAENGLEAAKHVLLGSPTTSAPWLKTDSFLVLRADGTQTNKTSNLPDSYYFLAMPQGGTNNLMDYRPLFSTPSSSAPNPLSINLTASPVVGKPVAPTGPYSNSADTKVGGTTKQYPEVYSFQQAPYTSWQEIKDPNDSAGTGHSLPYQRYTFWIEDLSGYLDVGVVGNQDGTGKPRLAKTAQTRTKLRCIPSSHKKRSRTRGTRSRVIC